LDCPPEVKRQLADMSRQKYLRRLKNERAKAALSLLRQETEFLPEPAETNELVDVLRREFERLPRRTKEMMAMRWGLDGGSGRTLARVGRRFGGVTRDAVRQAEDKVIKRLKRAAEVYLRAR